MKPKFLIDKCVGGKKLKRVLSGTITVNDLGLYGASDEIIFKKSKKKRFNHHYKRPRFVSYSLDHNKEAIFVDANNEWYSVAEKITFSRFDKKDLYKTYGDTVTRDLVAEENIIAP